MTEPKVDVSRMERIEVPITIRKACPYMYSLARGPLGQPLNILTPCVGEENCALWDQCQGPLSPKARHAWVHRILLAVFDGLSHLPIGGSAFSVAAAIIRDDAPASKGN